MIIIIGLSAADDGININQSDKAKLLWDFSIQTDHEIQSRRPEEEEEQEQEQL